MTMAAQYFAPVRDLSDRDLDRPNASWPVASPALTSRVLSGLRSAQVFDEIAAAGFDDIMTRHVASFVATIESLPEDWDSYGGRTISVAAANVAKSVLFQLLRQGVPAPSLVPRADGGIGLEWHRPGRELVVNVPGSDEPWREITAFYSNDDRGEEWEELLRDARPRVEAVLSSLTSAF